jgi:hypothetical protein
MPSQTCNDLWNGYSSELFLNDPAEADFGNISIEYLGEYETKRGTLYRNGN